ncbi:TrmH family RNA methyltransferase [Corynebacterium lipophiloflavum]|uniref:RNA methyltransferase, TrmH family n=1 Tax=Corynebacterium lipophiloflavum (strain ATCC 700352 / DSM 44291 / CCUG 37336 / JCM 10383 / DMMZ 1944) TaxID=525263 RepID=C0XPT1_CORLD|nr:RNA methyltransferase [Corynebacterium lipophiloflavum]EEI17763.1 RNA methyltransferase, TrmH family [Corynebacterium lipophiloflavum DSM 44291]
MGLNFSQAFTERTPRIVNAAKLHRAAARKKAGRFIVEGANSVEAAVATGSATDVFATESAAGEFAEILTTAGYMDVFTHAITDTAARHLSDTVSTTGIFALCTPVLWSVGKVLRGGPRLVAVCVETNDPGNAGTLIRIADVCGADAVVFAGDTVDPESSKAVRASAGSLFHVPVARERNISDVMGQLKAAGLSIAATTMGGDVSLDDAAEVVAQPTAWLFGNEAHGLPQELIDAADHRVSIPIRGHAESLNLATAAAMCMWESSKVLSRPQVS